MAEKVTLWTLVGLIPTQLGKHWWPEWSLVAGIPVDYLSPTLYLLDLVWLGWAVMRIKNSGGGEFRVNKWWLALAVLNIAVAGNKAAAIMGWLRWWQWWTVVWWAANNREVVIRALLKIVPIWVLVEAGLSLAQVVGGGSVGGFFWLLGERRFNLSSIGAPLWGVGGTEWVRAVGTFSHPNSLAGFGLLTAGWWYWERKRWQKGLAGRTIGAATLAGLGMVMFLAASRMVWVVGLIMAGWWLVRNGNLKQKVGWGLLGAGAVVMMVGVVGREYELRHFVGGWDKNSINKRWTLLVEAKEMVWKQPVFGVGLNNWWNQQNQLGFGGYGWGQPVHNIAGLWVAETGLAGLAVAVGLVIRWRRTKKGRGWLLAAGIVLVTGLVDHYWVTLPQNRWLWGIIWAII